MPHIKVKNCKIQNTFNPFNQDDSTASFSIYKSRKTAKWCYQDFGDSSYCGDAFNFAQRWYKAKVKMKLPFGQLLNQIYCDLDLDGVKAGNKPRTLSGVLETEIKSIDTDYVPKKYYNIVERENFTPSEIEYWNKYKITLDVLKEYNVVSVKSYECSTGDGIKTFNTKLYEMVFAYKSKNHAKIYRPNQKERFYYLGNKPTDAVFGLEQLPDFSPGDIVILTGGEKDVFTLRRMGYLAICLNSETSAFPDYLGKILYDSALTLVILYDLDETGERESEILAKKFHCKNVKLPEYLRGKVKDISDYISLGFPEDEIRRLIEGGDTLPEENTATVLPINDLPVNNQRVEIIEPSNEENNYVTTGEQLLNLDLVEIPTLIDGVLPKVGLAAVGGSSDTGKSTFLRQLAIAICANEENFLGFKINATHNSCVYVSTEDDNDAMGFLLKRQNAEKKYDIEKYKDLRYIFNSEKLIEGLTEELKRRPADVVIIDAYSDIFSGEINQSNKVRSFLDQYSNLAKKYKCLVVFLHHTGKTAEDKEPSKHNLLGSQGFEAKVRVVIELRKDITNPNIRHACIVKGNYIKCEMKNRSFELEFSENMLFKNTGRRANYDTLVRGNMKAKEIIDHIKLAKEMRQDGKSYREIAEKTGISKSEIHRKLKDE